MRTYVVVMVAVLGVGLGALAAVRWLDGRDDPTEPATAQALAAAVRRHMPTEARLVRARDGGGSPSKHVAVILEYEIGGNPVSLNLEANNDLPWPGDYDGCTSPPGSGFTCEIRTLEGGTKLAVAHLESSPPATGVSVKRADQVVSVWVSPSKDMSDLPVTLEVLTGITTDPLIGLRTSRQMLEKGKDIEVAPPS